MAYQRCGRSKTPATSTARDADYLLDADYLFGQNMTEHNPAASASGPPPDIHQNSPLRALSWCERLDGSDSRGAR